MTQRAIKLPIIPGGIPGGAPGGGIIIPGGIPGIIPGLPPDIKEGGGTPIPRAKLRY
jgi:hypothetical protein